MSLCVEHMAATYVTRIAFAQLGPSMMTFRPALPAISHLPDVSAGCPAFQVVARQFGPKGAFQDVGPIRRTPCGP